jgi:TRAP transporter TAXI family solute receptor
MKSGRGVLLRGTALVAILVLLAAIGAWMLQASIPRRIVIATGVQEGLYHAYAQRYREILARDGVKLEERMTAGSAENARLIADPKSGVDVAFMQGGVVKEPGNVVMLTSLYYEPLWVFYRDAASLDQLNELRGKRIAVGNEGQGVRAFLLPMLVANGITEKNSTFVGLGNHDALRALQGGQVDAAAFVGGAHSSAIDDALRNPALKLMDFRRAEAYVRRFPHVSHLVLSAGTFDLAADIPRDDVNLIATEAMLVARDDLPTALVHLLIDAAREIHSSQGYFEKPREFPNTEPVDVPVSADADRHQRFGPSFIHRTLPFFFATFVERLVVLLIPLLVLIVPLVNLLPQLLRWRARSRIYRWYGELVLLERELASRTGSLPIAEWLDKLDRIEAAAARIKTPASYAAEAYTLREHIALVRRSILARAEEKRNVELAVS